MPIDTCGYQSCASICIGWPTVASRRRAMPAASSMRTSVGRSAANSSGPVRETIGPATSSPTRAAASPLRTQRWIRWAIVRSASSAALWPSVSLSWRTRPISICSSAHSSPQRAARRSVLAVWVSISLRFGRLVGRSNQVLRSRITLKASVLRRRRISSLGSTGFSRKSVAPSSSTRSLVRASLAEVITMTGIILSTGSARTSRSTSKPDMPGIIRSSSSTSGCSARSRFIAATGSVSPRKSR